MKNFSLEKVDSVLVVTLDQPGEKVNTLTSEMQDEFKDILNQIQKDDDIKSVVLISGKEGNFIAGADINLFRKFSKPGDAERLSRQGNKLLLRLARMPKPVVAAIQGEAFGGGLELALACHYRIASDHPKTRFSLPEVKLGLIPAAGGTQRLPRLIGLANALDMMLTGKQVYPYPAKKMGLIDEVIHPYALKQAAVDTAKRLASKKFTRKSSLSFPERMLEKAAAGRAIIYNQAKKKVLSKTRGNYPAPLKILYCVRAGMEKGMKTGLEAEALAFDDLVFSRESKMLVSLFFAMQNAKKNPLPDEIQKVEKVGILGSGLMGSGIADVSIQAGFRVLMKDTDLEAAGKGLHAVNQNLEQKVSKKIISPFEKDRLLGMITPVSDYEPFKDAGLVIEAVFEDLELKQNLLRDVEKVVSDRCVFASNTSSLPISEIGKKAKRPENVLGMHYFSPVQKMPLLEIIKTPKTSAQALATAYEIGVKQGKTVIVVADGPGFYTTRILAPYMNEAMILLREGLAIDQLDDEMKNFGFPVGPAALMDEVGLDVGAHVADIMGEMFRKRKAEPVNSYGQLLEAGLKGKKNGKGFYLYGPKGRKEANEDIYGYLGDQPRKRMYSQEVQERLALVMINEAAHCLQEGIVSGPGDADTGAVFGLGFPPFLGGPFRYIDHLGSKTVLEKLKSYAGEHGNRFDPAQILKDYGKKNKKFHEG